MGRIHSPTYRALWACAAAPGILHDVAVSELARLQAEHGERVYVAAALGVSERSVERLEVALGMRQKRGSQPPKPREPKPRAPVRARPPRWCRCGSCTTAAQPHECHPVHPWCVCGQCEHRRGRAA